MKKQTISLILALALCLALLPVTASAAEITMPASLAAPVISDRTVVSLGVMGSDIFGYSEKFVPEVAVQYPDALLKIVENSEAGGTYRGRRVGVAIIAQNSLYGSFSDDEWDIELEQVGFGMGTHYWKSEAETYIDLTNANSGRLLIAGYTYYSDFLNTAPFCTRIKTVVYAFDEPEWGDPSWTKDDIILESPWSNVISNLEPEKVEYTGPRPNIWYAKGFDTGHGVGGGIINSSENYSSGRWGVLLCGKGTDGRYHISDAYVVRYQLEPWQSGSFCLYTQAETFDYIGRMFVGDYFEINPNLKLVYANLNSDKAYEVFTRFTGSRCELYKDYTPVQDGDNCVVENYGSPVDSAEASEWLYHYFGNELK